jgi:protein ImuA
MCDHEQNRNETMSLAHIPAGIDPRLLDAGFAPPRREDVVPFGIEAIDAVLPGGLVRPALHEVYATETADAAAMGGFSLALARLMAPEKPIVWIRQDFLDVETGRPYGPGLVEFGIDPSRVTLVRAHDGLSALQAALEAARCPRLGAVLVDLWGETRAFDLTASRRLSLAAEASGLPVIAGRCAARPEASAAETRWQARAAPSRAFEANAPGRPVFLATLLRQRSGAFGATWAVEWNRDLGCFGNAGAVASPVRPSDARPALSGAVVSLSSGRPYGRLGSDGGPGDGGGPHPDVRRAG